jgi:hypothetical protein
MTAADRLSNPRCAVTPYTLEKPGQEIHGLELAGNQVVKLRLLNPTASEDENGVSVHTGWWAAVDADNILHHVYPLPGMPLNAPDGAPVLGKPCRIAVLARPIRCWRCTEHGLSGPTRPADDPYTTGPVQCVAARRAVLANPPA